MMYDPAMDIYNPLLLAIWQEACRHIEVEESATRIADLLHPHLPMDFFTLYRLSVDATTVDRVCVATPGGAAQRSPATEWTLEQVQALSEWCRSESKVVRFRAGAAPGPIVAFAPPELGDDFLVGPLVSEHGTVGMVVLSAFDADAFSGKARSLLRLLLEPLAVALDNDQRLRELIALREAAEADKRSLLTRLGREAIQDAVVGADGGLQSVMERVRLVARSEAPVLILGETGSGKEVVARVLHQSSPRAAGPFIRVNCGAIPRDLIDSELFGHERGSFTGAVGQRRGWFERADGGTLFLDEIGELPLAAQVRLLRVVQEGVFERVGGEQPVHVSVRIVAATNRDLARMVQDHRFREDLWYRIAVFPIVIPPLRERKQDIGALARHFADRAARRFGLRPQPPSDDDVATLSDYDWPGNVRELASVIDRAAILGDGQGLQVLKALGPMPSGGPSPASTTSEPVAPELPTLDAAMRTHIERALRRARGKIEGRDGVAEILDINPHTLRARMRKLGIDWKAFRA